MYLICNSTKQNETKQSKKQAKCLGQLSDASVGLVLSVGFVLAGLLALASSICLAASFTLPLTCDGKTFEVFLFSLLQHTGILIGVTVYLEWQSLIKLK